jgi:RHS repeat-associated protein
VRYLLGLKPCGHVVSGQVRVYHADRLGSVRWVTDGSGNLVASYVYEGFGKIVGQSGGGGGPYQFCGFWGYRNDQDAGLLHVGARYYEVETGRWVQKDPILSLNNYIYCINIPTEFIDPNGTVIIRIFIAWIACIGEDLISGFVDDRWGLPISPPLDPDAWFGSYPEKGATWIDWGFGTIPSLVGIEVPLPFNLVKSTFFELAEYAAEQFWEAREQTGGILHKLQAIRSGVSDLW